MQLNKLPSRDPVLRKRKHPGTGTGPAPSAAASLPSPATSRKSARIAFKAREDTEAETGTEAEAAPAKDSPKIGMKRRGRPSKTKAKANMVEVKVEVEKEEEEGKGEQGNSENLENRVNRFLALSSSEEEMEDGEVGFIFDDGVGIRFDDDGTNAADSYSTDEEEQGGSTGPRPGPVEVKDEFVELSNQNPEPEESGPEVEVALPCKLQPFDFDEEEEEKAAAVIEPFRRPGTPAPTRSQINEILQQEDDNDEDEGEEGTLNALGTEKENVRQMMTAGVKRDSEVLCAFSVVFFLHAKEEPFFFTMVPH